MIVSFHNDMVIGDLSSRGQASELLTVLTAWSRHDANLPESLEHFDDEKRSMRTKRERTL